MKNIKLNKKTIQLIEKNGFNLSEINEQDGEYYIELSQYTPEGEDWSETIWFNGTNENFIESINNRVNNFDVDDEAEIFINIRGKNGVPDSIKSLIEDAEWKKKTLESLSSNLTK